MKTKLLSIGSLLFYMINSFGQNTVTLPYYEGFSYDDGTRLVPLDASLGQGDWFLFNNAVAASSNPLITSDPGWNPGGLPTPNGSALTFVGGGDDPLIQFTSQGTEFKLYSSFIFRIATPTTDLFTSTTGDYFYSFAKTSSTGTSLNYTSNVFLRKVGTTNTFNIGIAENNSVALAVWSSTAYSYDQDIVIIIKYQIDAANPTGLSSMWINPTITSVEPTAPFITTDDAVTSARTNIDKVRISKVANATTPNIILDEIRVGNTWNSVTGTTLGLAKNEISGLKVYPNPVSNGKLFISADNTAIKKVAVYDILGKQIIQKEVASEAMDVSGLGKGVYLVKITEGTSTSTRKFIVK